MHRWWPHEWKYFVPGLTTATFWKAVYPKAKLCDDRTNIVERGKGESYTCLTDVKSTKKNLITLIKILRSCFMEIVEVKREILYIYLLRKLWTLNPVITQNPFHPLIVTKVKAYHLWCKCPQSTNSEPYSIHSHQHDFPPQAVTQVLLLLPVWGMLGPLLLFWVLHQIGILCENASGGMIYGCSL